MIILNGIGVSSGITMGKALVVSDERTEVFREGSEPLKERARFEKALGLAKEQLTILRDKSDKEQAGIFEAHLMMLEDPMLVDQIKETILKQSVSAEYAIEQTIDSFLKMFEGIEDEYMRERSLDIKDIRNRLFKNLSGKSQSSVLSEDVIVVTVDLTPSDTVEMDREKVLGFVIDRGSRASHTAIMARSLQIPAIVKTGSGTSQIKDGDFLIVDGDQGIVYVDPDEETLKVMREKQENERTRKTLLAKLKGQPTETKDGIRVELAANIGSSIDLDYVISNDAEGIGLFRTEFLFMNRDTAPTEDEQFNVYKEVLEAMAGKPVVIRTLDVGGDKEIGYLDLPKELNPFLGYRGIRFCLGEKDLFRTQLRALLRASIYGNLKIMYPMISNLTELQQANMVLESVKNELYDEGVSFAKVEVGIMIETPAAALISDTLAKEVDFFSIGTNDLTQYTLAVDRLNNQISDLYDPFHPAVLSLVAKTIKSGHDSGIWVGMCGEVAGDERMIPILLAMGLDELSMNPADILPARELIRSLGRKEIETLLADIRDLGTGDEIKGVTDKFLSEIKRLQL